MLTIDIGGYNELSNDELFILTCQEPENKENHEGKCLPNIATLGKQRLSIYILRSYGFKPETCADFFSAYK